MYVDHLTFQVVDGDLDGDDVSDFFQDIGFGEVSPAGDVLEAGYHVRWFAPWEVENDNHGLPVIHLVGAKEASPLGLSHFCICLGDPSLLSGNNWYASLKMSPWLERDSGSGRIWLKGPLGIRVEVRP